MIFILLGVAMSLEEIKSGLDDLLSEKDNLRLDLTSKQAELLER